jgi:uroporphyrinogen-III synthase
MRKLLVLRPEPGASATVSRARALGLDAAAVPLFAVEPVAWTVPDGEFDALLLTSANAIRYGGAKLAALRALPVHAVGEATATSAREGGFTVASVGEVGVDELLAQIDPDLRLLHLCGEDRREPSNARQAITAVAVYRSVPLNPRLDADGAVALVHSPRAAQRLAELVGDRSTILLAAISQAAADAAGVGWAAVEVAECPTDEALLALARRL